MSFSRSIAAGFSILAISAARSPISERASATSSGRWTNDSAIQSAFCSSANARSTRSFSVSDGIGTSDVGDVDALVVGDHSADLDLGDDPAVARRRAPSAAPCRRRSGFASPERDRLRTARDAAAGRGGRCRAARRRSKTKRAPFSSIALPRVEMADAQLGALEVEQDRRRPAEVLLQRADRGRPAWPSASGRRGSC